MKKNDIDVTRVFLVENKMVVADNIEQAIEIYKAYYDYPYNDVHSVHSIDNGSCIKDYDALVNYH